MLRTALLALLCAYSISAYAEPAPAIDETRFIRDVLAEKGLVAGLDKDPDLLELVENFRQDQLARLALDAEIKAEMPDFSKRAQELYQVRKAKHYQLPLRLRVRILELHAPKDKAAEVRQQLTELRQSVLVGKQEFASVVMQHSQATDLSLTKGDSQWFYKGQRPDVIFAAAEQLSQAQPLSEIIEHRNRLYLLHYLDRKAPETLSFEVVKAELVQELEQEYREARQKVILDALRQQYQQHLAAAKTPAKD